MSTLEGPEVREGILVDEWHSLYNDSWKGLISEASFAHPAKMALGLLRRIFAHAKEEQWLVPKGIVLDPFAGIGTTALESLLNGCAFQGVELEPRFFALMQSNIAQWIHDYRHLPNFGPWAMVVNGDSRRLCEVLGRVPAPTDLSVASPPFGDSDNRKGGSDLYVRRRQQTGRDPQSPSTAGYATPTPYGDAAGNLANMSMAVSSPPYADAGKPDARGLHFDDQRTPDGRSRREASIAHKQARGVPDTYGDSPGNLANLAVSSPPYAEGWHKAESTAASEARMRKAGYSEEYIATQFRASKSAGNLNAQDYGSTPGQLGSMPVDLTVASPPYADGCGQQGHDYHPERMVGTRTGYLQRDSAGYGTSAGQLATLVTSSPPYEGLRMDGGGQFAKAGKGGMHPYDDSPVDAWFTTRDQNNIANNHPETFWEAARAVCEQTYALLRPGAHAIWVLKSYVRDKKIVNFPAQWQAMCESVGFVTLHEHHAMLVEEHGTQTGLFGDDTIVQTERKSFFRRLAEKRGSPRIDAEIVLCMVKPAGEGDGATCAISSPPYVETPGGNRLPQQGWTTQGGMATPDAASTRPYQARNYGATDGQLGAMPAGSVDLCTSSPPYSVGLGKEHTYADPAKREKDSHRRIMREKHIADPFYGSTAGNLGNLPDDPPPTRLLRPRRPRVAQERVPAPKETHG